MPSCIICSKFQFSCRTHISLTSDRQTGFYECGKVNRENYDKVKVGMEYFQVIELIGEPDKCDAALGMKNCVWGMGLKTSSAILLRKKFPSPA